MKALMAYGPTGMRLLTCMLRALRSTLTICVVALLVVAYRQGGFDGMNVSEVRWRNPIFLFLGLFIWEAWWSKVKSNPPANSRV